jgi:F-type H+-transporting ATPase subunit delta
MASVASTYARAFADVVLSARQKRRLLDVIAERDGVSKQVRNLVAVLIDHRRIHFLDSIIAQLEKELDARLGFAEAEITSARDLGDAEKRGFETQVEKLTGKKVRTHYGLDPSLLGGAVVRVGSTIYDGSVRGQLERLKEAISS